MSQNFFEKHGKVVLIAINLLFILLIAWIFTLNIFQDAAGSEKYSLYNKIEYNLRCKGKRNIALRENKPTSKLHPMILRRNTSSELTQTALLSQVKFMMILI